MRNISTWKELMITGSTKTTCKLLLGAGLQSTGPMGWGEAKVVCFFKEDIIEKLFLYHTVSIVVMPPTPPPPPPQPLYEFRQQRGRRQVPVLLKGISRQLLRPSKQSCWRGGWETEGGRWGRTPLCSRWPSKDLYTSSPFCTWRRKVITAQTQALETISCPVNNGIGEKELSDWMS